MLRRRLDQELHGSDGFTSARRVLAICLAVSFLSVAAHMLTVLAYDGRMLPGTVVANQNVGGKTISEVRKLLAQKATAYKLNLTVAQREYRATAADLGISYDVESTVMAAYDSGRGGFLPLANPEPVDMAYRLNVPQLTAFVESVRKDVGTPPVDATLVVKAGTLEEVPDKSGWSIDGRALRRLILDDATSTASSQLAVRPSEQKADIQRNALPVVAESAKRLMATPIVLTYNERTFTPTPAQIGEWLAFVKEGNTTDFRLVPRVDSTKLKNYIQNLANTIDIPAVNKKINVENGVSKVTQEGKDGLAVDQDILTRSISEAVNKQQPLVLGITTRPVPFKTVSTSLVTLDLPRYIEVNLSKQYLWVWQDRKVIYETPITSGAVGPGFETVTGLFSIYYKTTNTRLRGYQYGWDYDVAVKYWMPFYKGFGLHDASWRGGKFGGPDYYWNGSHGCVNLPDAASEFIYNWATIGTPVWVHK